MQASFLGKKLRFYTTVDLFEFLPIVVTEIIAACACQGKQRFQAIKKNKLN